MSAERPFPVPYRACCSRAAALFARLPLLAVVAVLLLPLSSTTGTAATARPQAMPVERKPVQTFVTLPADVRHPEGMTADPATGDIYVGTFDAREPAAQRNNRLLRYDAAGTLLASRSFGPTPLTGLAFANGMVYLLNFGASKLQRLPADFSGETPVEDVATFGALTNQQPMVRRVSNPDGSEDTLSFGASGFPAPNGMAFDRLGNLYISDSFQAAVYRISNATGCQTPCKVELVFRDPLLATSGALPFGANGLALSGDQSSLYINNAGDNRVLRFKLPAGPLEVLAENVHGADGLLFHDGLLWVASNQSDSIVALTEQGLVKARFGDFQGLDGDGRPIGLLFPASTAMCGQWMIVTNLALPITPSQGDEWEEKVRLWTLARFRLPDLEEAP